MDQDLQIVLSIPGTWPTRAEIVAALVRQGRFLFTGNMITDITSQLSYSLDIHERDEQLPRAFELGGQHSLGPADLAAIERHTYVLYVIGPGGVLAAARDMASIGAGLLDAGGLAVRVETSGAAHSAADWRHLVAHQAHDAALFEAYVTFIAKEGSFFSCGMHNLGLPDALVENVAPNEAGELLQTFLLYALLEQPELRSGNSFSIGPQLPRYRLTYEECATFARDSLFYNPFGVWRLAQT